MKALGKALLVLVVLYFTSYIVLRSKWTHVNEQDRLKYMNFPISPGWIYYFYRPLSIADAAVSGMRFHIGPHQTPDADIPASATPAPTSPAPEPAK